ncbi:MAG: mannose-1-phosphate guanylyltransferase [Leptonema sp. (in: bacteria)]
MKKNQSNRVVLIMAGGKGERFWPKSTENKPKQLQKIYSSKTLLEETYERAKLITDSKKIYIGCNEALKKQILKFTKIHKDQFIVEPIGRNTAPIIALATLVLEEKYPNAVYVVLSADHYISPIDEFKKTIETAIQVAEKDYLVTCGVVPSRPEIGYGYIQKGQRIEDHVYEVTQFHEKPELPKALEYLKKGFYWNSGIFIWTGSAIRNEFEKNAKEIWDPIKDNFKNPTQLKKVFPTIPDKPIDIAIMEKANKIAVVESTFVWDDVGTWLSLERIYNSQKQFQDEKQNITILSKKADFYSYESFNNIIVGESEKLFSLLGVENCILVETKDVIFLAKKDKIDSIKNMLKEIKNYPHLLKYL